MTSRQLKIARSRLGWSQVKLAKELGVTVFTLSKYENLDKYPRDSKYRKKIPRTFDLAMKFLLREESGSH